MHDGEKVPKYKKIELLTHIPVDTFRGGGLDGREEELELLLLQLLRLLE